MPLDLNKPVQTRDGRPVRILCENGHFHGKQSPVVGLVRCKDGFDAIATWGKDGRRFDSIDSPHDSDLVNVPTKREGWVNVYKNIRETGATIYGSEDHARRGCDDDEDVATIKIEWED